MKQAAADIAVQFGLPKRNVYQQRHTPDAAKDAVAPRAWLRIARAAEAWAATQPDLPDLDWRFDLIAVSAKGIVKHFRDYWRP